MIQKISPYIRRFAQVTVPPLTTILIVLLSQLPYGVPSLPEVMPALSLIAVYYWSIYRPKLLPSYAVFLIGLIQDIISGMPIGLTALVLLIVHVVVISQRQFFLGKIFIVQWWGFFCIAAGSIAATWFIASVFYVTALPFFPFTVQFLLTIALYPLFMWMLTRVRLTLLKPA